MVKSIRLGRTIVSFIILRVAFILHSHRLDLLNIYGGGTPLSPDEPKVRSLVTSQFANVKTDHYHIYFKPSWRYLLQDRTNIRYSSRREVVQADLFIACVPEVCNQIDQENCFQLETSNNSTHDTAALRKRLIDDRQDGELLCYYAPVEEKKQVFEL